MDLIVKYTNDNVNLKTTLDINELRNLNLKHKCRKCLCYFGNEIDKETIQGHKYNCYKKQYIYKIYWNDYLLYIGQTHQIETRLNAHRMAFNRKEQNKLYEFMDMFKIKWEDLVIKTNNYLTKEELNYYEKLFIYQEEPICNKQRYKGFNKEKIPEKYNPYNKFYNYYKIKNYNKISPFYICDIYFNQYDRIKSDYIKLMNTFEKKINKLKQTNRQNQYKKEKPKQIKKLEFKINSIYDD